MAVVIFNPASYFDEYANALHHVLQQAGMVVVTTSQLPLPAGHFPIMFGLLSPDIPAPDVPYLAIQLEQITSSYFTQEYLQKLRGAVEVWDFSASSLPFLREQGINAYHVPLGKIPTVLTPLEQEEVDVVFLGILNDHRRDILQGLRDVGIQVEHSASAFGLEKQELIARARLVLNLHYYPAATLEQLRILPALSTGKLVISEVARDSQPMALFGATKEEIIALCQRWLNLPAVDRRRKALELLAQIPDFTTLVPVERLRGHAGSGIQN